MVASAGGHGSLIGATLGGYEVVALIGRGAMGSVYLARDTKLNRLVALKVLLGSLARTPSLVKQFHQEAQHSAPLNHPGIVRIYSAGIEGGTPYIAMEYVDGEPLDRFLKRKGTLKWDVALHIGSKLALALDCAHQSRIVHRDIKPSNIMLDHAGNVRLTDFGIASIQSDEGGEGAGNNFIGTPQYMSPEQVTNKGVGPSSDLYALGVVLYQMMSGEMPFKGESSVALIKNICTEDAVRLNKLNPEIPDDVARLVAYLMEKDPKKRPANAKVAHGLMNRLQRQKGGGSVLSESLESFIRDSTEPRPFSNLYGKSGTSKITKKKAVQSSSSVSQWTTPWAGILRGGLVAMLALIAFGIGPVWGSLQRTTEINAAPVLLNGSVRSVSAGVDVVELENTGYKYSYVSWVGREPAILVEVGGKDGRLSQGSRGLIAVDLGMRQVYSVHPPVSRTLDDSYDPIRASSIHHVVIPHMPTTSPLYGSLITNLTDERSGDIVSLAHPWNEVHPRPQVLYRTEGREWNSGNDAIGGLGKLSKAIPHPNGSSICMVLMDVEMGYPYILENEFSEDTGVYVQQRRTTPGSDIISDSVRYSVDGTYIYYLRRRAAGDAELWRMETGDTQENGQRILAGVSDGEYSISLDDRQALVIMRNRPEEEFEVALIQLPSGIVEKRFGPGEISDFAWHSSGTYAMAVQIRGTDMPQLVALEAHEPYRAATVTMVNKGVDSAYALSPDGRQVALVARNSSIPSLLVLDLDTLEVDTKLSSVGKVADLRSEN